MPGQVDLEMHAGCYQRWSPRPMRSVLEGDDAELREAFQVRERLASLRPVSVASSRTEAGL